MGFKDLINDNKDSMRSIVMTPQFIKACPALPQFANQNKEIFR